MNPGPESRRAFGLALSAAISGCAALAIAAPIGLASTGVALLAGPHNVIALRYGLARLPARAGRLAPFLWWSGLGLAALSTFLVALTAGVHAGALDAGAASRLYSGWLMLLVVWVAGLGELRAAQAPRRHWPGLWFFAAALLPLCWSLPSYLALALVYLHPLVALAVLDRELARTRPAWVDTYRRALALVPVALAAIAAAAILAPRTSPTGELAGRVLTHAGAGLLPDFPPLALVGAHAFLEMLHYAVWLVAIPMVALRGPRGTWPIPLARRSPPARRAVTASLVLAMAAAAALWAGFARWPVATRDLYFTVAIVHVLVEVPLLWRLQ